MQTADKYIAEQFQNVLMKTAYYSKTETEWSVLCNSWLVMLMIWPYSIQLYIQTNVVE